jgi:hypothetical protein
MKTVLMKTLSSLIAGIAGMALAIGNVAASTLTPWAGSAHYTVDSSTHSAGPFSGYDLGIGAVLLQPVAGTNTYNGYFQSYVGSHTLNGTDVATSSQPGLVTNGSGAGYELTAAGKFQEETSTDASGNVHFNLTGGTFNLYADKPNYNFGTDSGFTDGKEVLTGTVVGGTGNYLSGANLGVSSIDILVQDFDPSVFQPATLAAGSSAFTLQLGGGAGDVGVLGQIASGNNTVLGQSVSSPGALLFAGDGNISLQAVPIPAALPLFGSALTFAGVFSFVRRRPRS